MRMTLKTRLNSTPDYTMGYGDAFIKFLSGASVEENIVFLRPHLRPGLRVLDVGCGPGHVSLAMARAVAPGEAYGIDMEPTQVEMSRQLAAELGAANATFDVADALRLPFDDGFFDIVNFCDVLAYIPDTQAVLSEARRALKPGGVVHCREMIVDSNFVHPTNRTLDMGWEMFASILESDDGHPQMGKEIYGHLCDAGFTDIRVSGAFNTFVNGELERFYNLVTGWFLDVEMTDAAKIYGAATADDLSQLASAVELWREQSGAYAAFANGMAVGVRP